ncbi:MAG: tyrosine-type recombinase/integrase [Paludibacteraceae bacterium]
MGRIRTNRPVGSFFLRKDLKPNKEGKNEIYIRYYLKRMPAKSPTTVWVYEKDWDEVNQRIRKSESQHVRLNNMLDKRRNEIDTLLLEFSGNLTIDILRSMVIGTYNQEKKNDEIDFIQYTLDHLEHQYKSGKLAFSTLKNAKNYMNTFKKFVKRKTSQDVLPMNELTDTIVDDYITYRQEERGNSNESINKTLTPIIKAAKRASANGYIKQSLSALLEEKYLIIKPDISQEENVNEEDDARYLTEEQLQLFLDLYDTVKYDRTREYMDMFLFSFHSCGLRFSDLLTLRWDHIDWEKKEINKILYKGNVSHCIPLTDAALKILDVWKNKNYNARFVFDLLPVDFDLKDKEELERMRINKNTPLKTSLMSIGYKMDLPFNLTIHIARHTFAVMALNKNDVSLHIISKILAHSSIMVTEKVYAKFLPETIDDEVKRKLSFDFMPKTLK